MPRAAGACATAAPSPRRCTAVSPIMSRSAPASRQAGCGPRCAASIGPAERIFVSTADACRGAGRARDFRPPSSARCGVDLDQFTSDGPIHPKLAGLPRPILLSVGRVAVEKNLEAFLDCPVAGSKVVVGDGPALAGLKQRYGKVRFPRRQIGSRAGVALSLRGRVRLSEPDGHVRTGQYRGAGVRGPGGGVPGRWAARYPRSRGMRGSWRPGADRSARRAAGRGDCAGLGR